MSKKIGNSLFEQVFAHSGLTRNQVQLWIGQRLNIDSPHYNMAFLYFLEAAVDEGVFCSVWQQVVDANDVLRTRIEQNSELPKKGFHPTGSCRLKIADFSNRSDPEKDLKKWAHARCATALPIDGELVDSVLVKLSKDRFGWYLNQHHLVTDGGSTLLLYRAVIKAYLTASKEGCEPPIEPHNEYYETISSIQRSTEDADVAKGFWKTRHQQLSTRNTFWGRSDKVDSTSSRRVTLKLTSEQSSALRTRSQEDPYRSFFADISLFAVFSTLYMAWMHQVSGQKELRFDAPVPGRTTSAARNALGLFIEMFPFALSLEEGEQYRTLGAKCFAEAINQLKEAVPGSSFTGESAASSAVLNFFPTSFDQFEELAVKSEWIHSGHSDNVHAVRLQVHDYDQTGFYTLHFDFNEDHFPSADQERAVYIFQQVLEAFLADMDNRLADLDSLSPADKQSLLVDFNDSKNVKDSFKSVVELFREQAVLTPQAIALRQGGEELSYADLEKKVFILASILSRKSGSMANQPMAVFMERSVDAVVAVLAVLASGNAYVPVDPAYPKSRIQYILEDCGATVVLTHRGMEENLAMAEDTLLKMEDIPWGESSPNLDYPLATDLAYVIYTSGSTGQPKGVLIEHAGLTDYLLWASSKYVRNEKLSFPLFTSLSFDLTVTSLFLPLVTGGELIVYEEPDGPVDSSVIDVISDNRVDIIKLTPSHLSLLQQLDLNSSRIRRMILGGEDLKVHLAATITEQLPEGLEIFNEYGPTEAVVGCMIHKFAAAQDCGISVPIGVPSDNVQLYVLNHELQPTAPGVPGELCISGIGLARGYHNRPELTGQRFVPNPFIANRKMYRTGDLVRFNRRGLLEYLGRIDRQMKISGFRIEPGEIEKAILSVEGIEACVVTTFSPARHVRKIENISFCSKCGLPSNYPKVIFDEHGVCNVCSAYESIREEAQAYFKSMPELGKLFQSLPDDPARQYDCLALLSGGKDSTFALCQLVDMGLKVFAYTLDNGYISDDAKNNIQHVVKALGVDHEFATTSAMNLIFKDSLTRFSNVCNGCFKTIYTLSVNRAVELKIPFIVTGLSRGQFFETRLTEKLFKGGRFSPEDIDRAVLEARKVYHRNDDAVTRSLDNFHFETDDIFTQVRFVDFYRYCDVNLSDMMDYLKRRVSWVRPSDTGRSTNCLINDIGIYIHNKERGYHNYALPYSWDVRMGHKTRDEALHELNDDLDMEHVREMLSEVEYDEDRLSKRSGSKRLLAYYVPTADISETDLRRYLASTLPNELVPHRFIAIDGIPLSPNGKVDFEALPSPELDTGFNDDVYVQPVGPVEEKIADIWKEVLGLSSVSASDSFFQSGGTSLDAMEVMLSICNTFELNLPLQSVFQHTTIPALAQLVESTLYEEISGLSEEEAENLAGESSASKK